MNKVMTNDKTIDDYKRKFYKLYTSSIKPLFRYYEKERKSTLQKCVCLVSVVLVIAVIIGMSFCNSPTIVVGFMTVAIIVAIAIPRHYDRALKDKLKHSCMDSVLNLLGDIHWYQGEDIISDAELEESGLFSTFNRREVDDGFRGTYKDVPFEISETGMRLVTGSGKNRKVVHIFKGVVIKYRANKIIKNKTIVATKGDNYIQHKNGIFLAIVMPVVIGSFIAALSHSFDLLRVFISTMFTCLIVCSSFFVFYVLAVKSTPLESLEEVKLEDPEFSKKYNVYSSNQIEGRFLITPAFMERFKNIQTAFGTNKVKCSFYGDSLMFAISTNKNLFELGSLFKSLEDPAQLETFFNELISIYMLIDYFKLDESTGL